MTVGCGAVIARLVTKPEGGGVCNPESVSFSFKLGVVLLVPARDVFDPPNQPRNTGVARAEVGTDPDWSGLVGIATGSTSLG